MYFLKDIMPTPPISVHPYPNFCRIYPPKFPQIPTLLYSTIIKLYRKKNEHVNTKIPPLRRDRKPHFLYVRQNWNTKLQFGNSQNSHGSIALRSPKAQDWMATQTFCRPNDRWEIPGTLRSYPAPSPLSSIPPSLAARPHSWEQQGWQSHRPNNGINNGIFITGISKDRLQVLKMGVEKNQTENQPSFRVSSLPSVTGELRPKRSTREEFHIHQISGTSLIPPSEGFSQPHLSFSIS